MVRQPVVEYNYVNWGAIQATGAPNTNSCGDLPTAWSPRTSGSDPEWLKTTYDQAVYATGLRVHETYLPGFITGIDLVEPNGTVHALTVPADTTTCGGYYVLSFAETAYLVNAIVVHTAKPGYEEIDAVELTGIPAAVVEYSLTINQVGNGTSDARYGCSLS